MTNSELVSRVLNDFRLLNKDQHISRRFVLNVAKSQAKSLIAQKLPEGILYKDLSLYKTIKCFRLRPDDVVKCDIVEFRRCRNLMKSVEKLPEMIYSRHGTSVLSVTSIDGLSEFTPTTVQKYQQKKKRSFGSVFNTDDYYIHDGYLYLPDSEVELVDVTLMAVSESDVDDCSTCGDGDGCKSGWSFEFNCPDLLKEAVIQGTLREVATYYKGVVVDENPNLTEHQKDKITN